MKHFIGMDLGAENLRFVLADENGEFRHVGVSKSPFKRTGGSVSGTPEVFIDTILTDTPKNQRVSRYLIEKYCDFFDKAHAAVGFDDFEAIGAQMCGKVWQSGGTWYLQGSNTPARFASEAKDGSKGIVIDLKAPKRFVCANDGNAAAKAQSIYYKAKKGLVPNTTGYIILGGGLGFGVPDTETQTEGGHLWVSFMHPALRRKCGCSPDVATACAENYASGPGLAATVKQVIEYYEQGAQGPIASIAEYERAAGRIDGLKSAIKESCLYRQRKHFGPEKVMEVAEKKEPFASWVVELAVESVATVAIASAQLYGLERIGIGESVAENNPWFVDKIADRVKSYTNGNTLLPRGLTVEMTPIKEPGKYGALSMVIPTQLYGKWADVMKK